MNTTRIISRNLSALMTMRHLDQTAIARAANVSNPAVSHWMSNRSQPSPRNLSMLAEAYGLTLDDLTSEHHGLYAKLYGLTDAPQEAKPTKAPRRAFAPLYGKVHAGDAEEPVLLNESVPIPYEIWEKHKSAYFLEVVGGCMDKVYPEGCLVLVDPSKKPQNGSIAVVSIDGGDFIMRRMYKGSSAVLLCPDSHNKEWGDIVIEGEHELKTYGTVVWFQPKKELA